MSLAAQLAEFALKARPDSASTGAEAVMALSLYDWMACGMAGSNEPVAQVLRGMDHAEGQNPIFGAPQRLSAAAAAWVNGATSHALDYDDTHFAHIGHPSVAVLPAAFACATSGEDLLWSALIGAETSVRLGQWLGRAHYQTGFHQTATAGAFGAAAAAGRLLGLNSEQMQAAFGVAATQAAGLKSQFGTMGKPYHAGLAARTGVEAAQLARAGFDTRGAGLDGPLGFGATHHGENDLTVFEDMGQGWRMETVSHKFHACCHGLHAMLEALGGLNLAAEQVARIEIQTHPRWLTVCDIDDPQTGLECKFSYRHTAAMCVLGHATAALESFSDQAARDPALSDLRGSVRVTGTEALAETASRVTVHLKDNRQVEAAHDLDAPMSLAQRREKLRRKVEALLGQTSEQALWQATHANKAPDLDALSQLMSS